DILPRNISGEAMTELELVQGTLDVLVLRTLSWGTRHGYSVARWIKESSGDALNVEDRALYVSLHRLEARGFVESDWGVSENNRKARYYRLTPAGRRELRAGTDRLTRYVDAVFRVLSAVPEGVTA
ncbi:MAG: PadR family transcriptional regulator, partial [Gemmatimonadaceae bacterium]